MSNPDALFLTLQGQLPAVGHPSDGTLINITEIEGNLIDDDGDGLVDNPGRVTLGILEVPATAVDVTPSITLNGAWEVAPPPSIFVTPGDFTYDETVGLNGTAATSEDSDGDRVSNDTDNCLFAANDDQLDRGGLNTTVADGRGDVCQCGESSDDGCILPADHPQEPGLGDVVELQMVLAGATPNAEADARCSVSSAASGSEDSTACNILDVIAVQQAVEEVPGAQLEPVCLRAVAAGLANDP